MKTYISFSIFVLIFTLTVTASAQNYPVLKSERIFTPWDTVTTLYHSLNDDVINLTEDGKLVMLASPRPDYKLRFYFYDEILKSWTAKYIVGNKLIFTSSLSNYSVGLKENSCSEFNDTAFLGRKWLFNSGDSASVDSVLLPSYAKRMEIASPSVSYYSTLVYGSPIVLSEEPGEPEFRPYSSTLVKRNYRDGKDTSITIISLKGGFKGYPENVQYYENDIEFRVINEETFLTAIHIEVV